MLGEESVSMEIDIYYEEPDVLARNTSGSNVF